MPRDAISEALDPVVNELRAALVHLADNHLGLWVMMDMRRRELARMHMERARQFLKMMPGGALQA
jgi:hypothetical protein